jgi:hypothetical protein
MRVSVAAVGRARGDVADAIVEYETRTAGAEIVSSNKKLTRR